MSPKVIYRDWKYELVTMVSDLFYQRFIKKNYKNVSKTPNFWYVLAISPESADGPTSFFLGSYSTKVGVLAYQKSLGSGGGRGAGSCWTFWVHFL